MSATPELLAALSAGHAVDRRRRQISSTWLPPWVSPTWSASLSRSAPGFAPGSRH